MGSGGSKATALSAEKPETSSRGGGGGGRGVRVFRSSCFGFGPSTSHIQEPDEDNGTRDNISCSDEALIKEDQENLETCRLVRIPKITKVSSLMSSSVENDGENNEVTSDADSGPSGFAASHSFLGEGSSLSNHSRPHFGIISDGLGFRLNRAASVGSLGTNSFFSASVPVGNCDNNDDADLGNRDARNPIQDNTAAAAVSSHEVAHNGSSAQSALSRHPSQNSAGSENTGRRRFSRHPGTSEQLERSVRFSRTLSVGRLRDRVLRRTTYSDGNFGSYLLEGQSGGYVRQLSRRQHSPSERDRYSSLDLASDSERRVSPEGTRGDDPEFPQLRDASFRDFLEHRSVFLERRRRIRSQVRALQRLGSRFGSFSGHDRSCIMSGQHRTGHCGCRTSVRPANPDEDTSTRASISRIVMLAEALFEVLDEIHQQSVTLTSRPSFSSIGSVPAPKEIVESMPVKAYIKPSKAQNEDTAQCYICLVEYEEGDYIRSLPCHHEFHQMCIDKWLKEIHRVCPLCRGDVCSSGSAPRGK